VKGKCVIFSAPSGAGKTTIVHHLLKQDLNLEFSISATSRSKREGEKDAVDYYFISPEEFLRRIHADEFIEWEEVYTGQYYGTLRSEIERIWSKGKHVIFDVDVIGGLNLKKQIGDHALAIFVMPPSMEILEERLRSRNTESNEKIAQRIAKASKEMKTANMFDHILKNDNLNTALAEAGILVKGFLEAES
jgi:guanylate kinase